MRRFPKRLCVILGVSVGNILVIDLLKSPRSLTHGRSVLNCLQFVLLRRVQSRFLLLFWSIRNCFLVSVRKWSNTHYTIVG